MERLLKQLELTRRVKASYTTAELETLLVESFLVRIDFIPYKGNDVATVDYFIHRFYKTTLEELKEINFEKDVWVLQMRVGGEKEGYHVLWHNDIDALFDSALQLIPE